MGEAAGESHIGGSVGGWSVLSQLSTGGLYSGPSGSPLAMPTSQTEESTETAGNVLLVSV